VTTDAGADVAKQVDRAYLLALGRAPDPTERARAVGFIGESSSGLEEFCHVLLNLNEFIYRP